MRQTKLKSLGSWLLHRLSEQNSPRHLDIELEELSHVVKNRLPLGDNEGSHERVRFFNENQLVRSVHFGDLHYGEGKIWDNDSDRSLSRYLHGLVFLADWPDSIASDPSGRLANLAYSVIRSWIEQYDNDHSSASMAYHDETTAQRMVNTLAFFNSAETHLNKSQKHAIQRLLDRTADLLSSESFHSTGNNHGMFQDQALINYTALAIWRSKRTRTKYFNVAENRIREYFLGSFTEEGVHRENTPTYHLMISWQLQKHCDLLNSIHHPNVAPLEKLLNNASRYATHCIMPNGQYPPISDTGQKNLAWNATRIFQDEHFDFAATKGRQGVQPPERLAIFEKSGYMIYRSSWTDSNATFLLFQAAYNADYHKHSDDLSIFLRSRNIDLITEAGPYGYNYKDPFTVYGFSQYAHNNIVVDGRSVPRIDKKSETVTLVDRSSKEDSVHVIGSTGRLRGANHTREVTVTELNGTPSIDIIDSVNSGEGLYKDFEILWNLGHETEVISHSTGFELVHNSKTLLNASVTADVPFSLELVRGRTEPTPLGWRFPKMGEAKPNTVVVIKFSASEACFVTKFRL